MADEAVPKYINILLM